MFDPHPNLQDLIAAHHQRQANRQPAAVTPLGAAFRLAHQLARVVRDLDVQDRIAIHTLLGDLLTVPAPRDPAAA